MYDKGTMKLTSTLFLLTAGTAGVLTAQTRPVTRHTPSKTATTHRSAKPAASADPCGSDALPPLVAAIPKTAGCPKSLYALHYLDTVVGIGPLAESHKWYTVNYTGYLTDGTKFDTSVGKDPITFPYGARQVIPGWDTGFDGMHIGGKRRLFIPYQLAYGEQGRPPIIPAKAELIFDLELVAISDKPPAPKTPPTPPPPPATPSGTAPAKPATVTPDAAKATPDAAKSSPEATKPISSPPTDPASGSAKPGSPPPSTTPKP